MRRNIRLTYCPTLKLKVRILFQKKKKSKHISNNLNRYLIAPRKHNKFFEDFLLNFKTERVKKAYLLGKNEFKKNKSWKMINFLPMTKIKDH